MADVEGYCLFCEDVRSEKGQKQTYVGVYGGSMFVTTGTEKIDKLFAVCSARITNRSKVNVSLHATLETDDNVFGTGKYSAEYLKAEDDDRDIWVLQLSVDLGGMPVVDDALAKVEFKFDEFTMWSDMTVHIVDELPDSLKPIIRDERHKQLKRRKARKRPAEVSGDEE